MNLAYILQGTEIAYHAIQSIQGLTIVPLTCSASLSFDDKYASPYSHKVSTSSYGTVHLHRKGDKPVLVPAHSAYITKGYKAQDHLISKAVILNSEESILRDSRCVESTQGGFMRETGDNEHVIAPLALREVAYNYVGDISSSLLWNDIGRVNNEHDAGQQQQLKDYFKRWNTELDKFIAHFERIDKCIGFITLYKDEVVAVDKFPSFTYTSQIWEKLVRDSYAALVIKDRLSSIPASTSLKTVEDFAGDRRLKISTIYRRLVNDRIDHYKNLMQEIAELDFGYQNDTDTPGSKILEHEGYIGQVIEQNGVNVMVSIIKKSSFDPTKMRESRAMRSIARNQRLFTI